MQTRPTTSVFLQLLSYPVICAYCCYSRGWNFFIFFWKSHRYHRPLYYKSNAVLVYCLRWGWRACSHRRSSTTKEPWWAKTPPPRPQCSPLCCRTHWSPLVPNFIAVNLIDIKSVRNLTRVFLLRRSEERRKKRVGMLIRQYSWNMLECRPAELVFLINEKSDPSSLGGLQTCSVCLLWGWLMRHVWLKWDVKVCPNNLLFHYRYKADAWTRHCDKLNRYFWPLLNLHPNCVHYAIHLTSATFLLITFSPVHA